MLEMEKDEMTHNIAPLLEEWLSAKQAEDDAKQRRLNAEAQITGIMQAKDEGAVTHKLDGYSVTLKQPVTRSLDEDAWEHVKHKIPQSFHPTVKTLKADGKGCKWLLENRPDLWNQVAPAFTTKAGKIGVSVKKEESN